MTRQRRRRDGWLWPAVFVAAAALTLATGRQLAATPVAAPEVPRVQHLAPVASPTPARTPAADRSGSGPSTWTTRSAAVPRVRTVAAPTRLIAAAVHLDLPVRPTTLDKQGQMALPDRPDHLGWYAFGSAPSDPQGAVVIAGHLDSARYGAGPLTRAAALSRGDAIKVEDADGRERTYRVSTVERLAKSDVASAGLFTRTGPRVLRLITCGGRYDPDRGGYQDNLVVTAEPA